MSNQQSQSENTIFDGSFQKKTKETTPPTPNVLHIHQDTPWLIRNEQNTPDIYVS